MLQALPVAAPITPYDVVASSRRGGSSWVTGFCPATATVASVVPGLCSPPAQSLSSSGTTADADDTEGDPRPTGGCPRPCPVATARVEAANSASSPTETASVTGAPTAAITVAVFDLCPLSARSLSSPGATACADDTGNDPRLTSGCPGSCTVTAARATDSGSAISPLHGVAHHPSAAALSAGARVACPTSTPASRR